ncbi:rod shape-determining protein MreD [Isachenkonia alkalipeptolytica]|nr:rod shape-determining protein MreD [Isachenkonia alkalipeptolytica]
MNKIIIIGILTVNIILQTTVLNFVSISSASLNTSLLLIVAISVYLEPKESFLYALYTGLLLDTVTGVFIGLNTFIFLLVAYGISIIQEEMVKESYLTPLVLGMVSIVLYNFLSLFFVYLMGYTVRLAHYFSFNTLIEIAYNSVFMLLIYTLFSKFYNRRIKEVKY